MNVHSVNRFWFYDFSVSAQVQPDTGHKAGRAFLAALGSKLGAYRNWYRCADYCGVGVPFAGSLSLGKRFQTDCRSR